MSAEEAALGCYEGRRPDSMAQDTNTYTFAFHVDWTSAETRVITDGIVQPVLISFTHLFC